VMDVNNNLQLRPGKGELMIETELNVRVANLHPFMCNNKANPFNVHVCIPYLCHFRANHLYAGLLLANSSRSLAVATPNTNLLLSSVTTANSCFPSPFSPPLKNNSSSSKGVSIVMILYILPFLRNLIIAFDTSSVSSTLPFSRRMRRCGIER